MIKRFAMTIFSGLLLVATVSAAEPDMKTISSRYDGSSIRRVQIELPPSTRLQVRTESGSEIRIEGEVTVGFKGSHSRLMRRTVLDGIEIIGEAESSNRLKIVDRREGSARKARARRLETVFDLTITVPEWTNVEVHQRDGSVVVDGAFGDVTVGMRAGEIRAILPKTRVKELSARTRVGEVRADYGRKTEELEGFFPGATTYENPAGQTVVRLNVTAGEIDVTLKE